MTVAFDQSAARAALAAAEGLHAPVLLAEVLAAMRPERGGVHIDGTFGAGGYARGLLEAGAGHVLGLDRDPEAVARAVAWAPLYDGKLALAETPFSALDQVAAERLGEAPVLGVALDLGVSSMQIDQPERGFSFQKDGPLDMRMGPDAQRSAAELVNALPEAALADVLFHFGEERASRRIARAILAARTEAPITTTTRLAEIVCSVLPRAKPGQPHPATRSFQALRVAVNREFEELLGGLAAAERALSPGGVLAVVTFHSLEDRIVKRFFAERRDPSGGIHAVSRHAPQPGEGLSGGERNVYGSSPSFAPDKAKPIAPSADEVARNPRARSAKLRFGARTAAPAIAVDAAALGAPRAEMDGRPPRGGRRQGVRT